MTRTNQSILVKISYYSYEKQVRDLCNWRIDVQLNRKYVILLLFLKIEVLAANRDSIYISPN